MSASYTLRVLQPWRSYRQNFVSYDVSYILRCVDYFLDLDGPSTEHAMGLFGRSATDSLLPFYQSPKSNGQVNGTIIKFASRRGSRNCERCFIVVFFGFFLGVFGGTLFFLPDISTTVQSVGRDFLIPDAFGSSSNLQIKKPRIYHRDHDFGNDAEKNKIKTELHGKLHREGTNAEQIDQEENEVQYIRGKNTETAEIFGDEMAKRRQLIVKVKFHVVW